MGHGAFAPQFNCGRVSFYSLFLIPYSLFLIPYSLFLIPYSLFLIPYSLIPYSLFPSIPYSLFRPDP